MTDSLKARRPGALVAVVVALALALLAGDPAGGASAATVRVGSAVGMSGDEVTVRLEVAGVPEPGLGAFTIDVTYDPKVASPVACSKDPDRIFDTVLCNTSFSGNAVRVGGFRTSSGATGSMALADITFRLVGQAGACGSLAPSAAEFADTQNNPIMPLDLTSGSLCIKGMPGEATETPGATPQPEGPGHTPAGRPGSPTSAPSPGNTVAAPFGAITIVPPPTGEGGAAQESAGGDWTAPVAGVAAVAGAAALAGCLARRRVHRGRRGRVV
jgi:hypothetical protein